MREIERVKYPQAWVIFSELILFLFFIVGYLEKIHSLYSVVIILDAVLAFFSFFFIVFYSFIFKEFRLNFVSRSLLFLSFSIIISSMVRNSDNERLAVALFALLELWAVIISLIILKDRLASISKVIFISVIIYSLIYSLVSVQMGLEENQLRYVGLSNQTNSLAVVASSSLLIALSLLKKRRNLVENISINGISALSIPFFLYTISKTDSRTSLFTLLFALGFFFILSLLISKKRKTKIITGIIVFLSSLVVIFLLISSSRSLKSDTLSSLTSGRTTIWLETLKCMDITDYLIGFGGNSSEMERLLIERGMSESLASYLKEKHLMHSIYLQFLVEYGFVAFISFSVCYIYLLFASFSVIRREENGEKREVVITSSVLLAFYFVHSFAESSIFFIGGAEQILFIFSFAVIYSYIRDRK